MKAYHTILLLAAVGACSNGPEADRTTLGEQTSRPGLPAEVQMPIDSGNAAYRAGDYAVAMRHYRTAAERAPNDVTPWIGVSMAAGALQDQTMMDSATARIRELAPDLLDSAAHGTPESAGAPHP